MIFTTSAFLWGGALAALIPLAIHLLSKGSPQRLVFPATRFARAQIVANRRRLKLKRLLLLSLRVLLFLTLGLALARPYFAARNAHSALENALREGQELGQDAQDASATILVLDTSARMARVRNSASLLDQARAAAEAILEQTSRDAQIAILDGERDGDGFLPDRVAAKDRLRDLEITPNGRTAAQSTLEALRLLARVPNASGEIFVLSDRTRRSWNERDIERIIERSHDQSIAPPKLYFIDLGDQDYRNASLVDVALSSESLSSEGALEVAATVERNGAEPENVAVETLVFNARDLDELDYDSLLKNESKALRRETRTLAFASGRAKQSAVFTFANLPVGACVGLSRIVGSDALEIDDARVFTFDVCEQWRALVVAPQPIESTSLFLTQALAPENMKLTGRASFDFDVIPYSGANNSARDPKVPRELQSATNAQLEQYCAIFLLDPPGMTSETLNALARFVERGKGLALFLGANAAPGDAFNSPEALRLVGAKLSSQERAEQWDRALWPLGYDEPTLASFRPYAQYGIPWDALPIRRFWKLEELDASSTTVVAEIRSFAELSNGSTKTGAPGLLEHRLGSGVVATLATPISTIDSKSAWNDLTNTDAAWVFILLVDGIARRVASTSSSILNYQLGEQATLRVPALDATGGATLSAPDGDKTPVSVDAQRRAITSARLQRPGLYRAHIDATRSSEPYDVVFAANIPSEEFNLSRYDQEEWDKLWQDAPYRALDLQDATQLDAMRGDQSNEPYVYLALTLALIFLLETYVSNRFYKTPRAA